MSQGYIKIRSRLSSEMNENRPVLQRNVGRCELNFFQTPHDTAITDVHLQSQSVFSKEPVAWVERSETHLRAQPLQSLMGFTIVKLIQGRHRRAG
jgi:hypothetical protein